MTWGQLRLQLQTALVGVSLDLLDEWLNSRYEQVLESTDWKGISYDAVVQTLAAYQSGTDTVTLTVGSNNVTGVGTTWTSAAALGLKFYRPGDTVAYTVVTWNSGTSIVIDRPYEGNGIDAVGTVYSSAPYVFCQDVYSLPADVSTVIEALDPVTGFPLAPFSEAALDASCGPKTLVNDPTSYAVIGDTSDTAPPVAHQIRFFPPPLHARGIPIKYEHSAAGFDGSNTSGSPMPWVSMSVLLYGCRADGYAYLAGKTEEPAEKNAYLQLAKMHEAKYGEELARLLRIEHQRRRPKAPIRMAPRFARHRLARAGRGRSNYWGPGQGGPN